MRLHLRYRLFLIAAALLYLGPLVAGLFGFDWQSVPIFTVIFLLWLTVMFPGLWPATPQEWREPGSWLRLSGIAAVQLALVVFCFAIGRGIGGTMNVAAPVPAWVPPLMSFFAIPIARTLWNPSAGSPEMAKFMRQATPEMLGRLPMARPDPAAGSGTGATTELRARAICDHFIAEISALPDPADDAAILEILARSRQEIHPLTLMDALAGLAEAGQVPTRLRRAYILHMSDPENAERQRGNGQLARGLDMAGEDALRLNLFAQRVSALLAGHPSAMMDMPAATRLRDIAARHPAAEAALCNLAAQMTDHNA